MNCFSRTPGTRLKKTPNIPGRWSFLNRCLPLFWCAISLFVAQSAFSGPIPPDTMDDTAPVDLEKSGDRIQVIRHPQLSETIYSLAGDYCRIQWTVYDSKINDGMVKHTSACEQPLQRQLPTISALLEEILKIRRNSGPFHTLFWGRLLTNTSQQTSEMSFRLTLAAFKSMEWDNRRGRPRQGANTEFVPRIANEVMIYPELASLFRAHGLHLALKSAEKVLVTEAKHLPFYDRLRKHGVMSDDRLPYDAMVWFSVTRWERSYSTPPTSTPFMDGAVATARPAY